MALGNRRSLLVGRHPVEVIGGATLHLDFMKGLDVLTKKPVETMLTTTRASSAYYTTDDGRLVNFPANVPRIGKRGLLPETNLTNYTLYSQNFQNAVWFLSGATVLDNQAVAPDGTLTAALFSESASTAVHQILPVVSAHTPTVAAIYPMSVVIKPDPAAPLRYVQLCHSFAMGGNAYVNFDLQETTQGTIGADIVASGIEVLRDGYMRLWALATAANTTTSDFRLLTLSSPTGARAESHTVTAGNEKRAWIWAAEFKNSAAGISQPTSYIPTTSSAVTRAADIITINDFTKWYNQAEGTFYARSPVNAGDTGVSALFSVDDITSNNRIRIGHNAATQCRMPIVTGGVALADCYSPTFLSRANHTFVGVYGLNYAVAYSEAGASILDTAVTIPTVTTARLGRYIGGPSYLDNYLEEVAYFPRKLTPAEAAFLCSAF